MSIDRRRATTLFLLTSLALTLIFVDFGKASPNPIVVTDPTEIVLRPCEIADIAICVENFIGLYAFEFKIWWLKDVVNYTGYEWKPYPPEWPSPLIIGPNFEENATHKAVYFGIAAMLPADPFSYSGRWPFVDIYWHCIKPGVASPLVFDRDFTRLYDEIGEPIPIEEIIDGLIRNDIAYWKEPYPDYAPSGLPDFSQKQDNWGKYYDTNITWTWCGPTAVADCLWWIDSKFEPGAIPPPIYSDGFPLVESYDTWDDHAPENVPPLIEELAWYMDCDGLRTDPCAWGGTFVDDMTNGINEYIRDKGLEGFLYAKMVEMPEFYFIEHEVERCEDVILLVGFWQLGELMDQHQEICEWCEHVDTYWNTWQEFKPAATSLSRVEVKIARTLGEANQFPITMTIESPLGFVLTQTTLPWQAVPELPWCETEWVSFDVPDIALTPGLPYYIVLNSEPFAYHWCAVDWDAYPPGDSNPPEIGDWTFRTFYKDWRRLGGHYLTVAGVDSEAWLLAVSDPYCDWAEPPAYPGDPDRGNGPGRVIPPPPHGHQPPSPAVPDTVHNNATYVSHDIYKVTPSESPGGIWQLEGYISSKEELVEDMAGQNCPRELLSYVGEQIPSEPIYTEIEFAVVVSPTCNYVWDQPYVEVQGTEDFDPGWPGWYVRHGSTGVAFTFTGVNPIKIVSEYVDVEFSLGIGNHMNAEKGLDGLLDVVINPDIENYTIQNVLFDNVDPTNHIYAYEYPKGTYETKAQVTVHKSFIHDGNLTIKLLRHTDAPDFLPVAPNCTNQPICLGTQDDPTPIIPEGVYENDDPHTVHICVATDSTGTIAAAGEVVMRPQWLAGDPPAPPPEILDLELYPREVVDLGDPTDTQWHELHPVKSNFYHLASWEPGKVLSPGDQIDMYVTDPPVKIYVENITAFDPTNPICSEWHETAPFPSQLWHLSSWEDNNGDGMLSPCDQIDMDPLFTPEYDPIWFHVQEIIPPVESEPWQLILDVKYWFEVDDVTVDLRVYDEIENVTYYLDYKCGKWTFDPYNPISTKWHEINAIPEDLLFFHRTWHLTSWDDNGDGKLGPCDWIDMTIMHPYEGAGNVTWFHVEAINVTLKLTPKPPRPEVPPVYPSPVVVYLESELSYYDFHPYQEDPVCTYWHEIYPLKSRWWHLSSWNDSLVLSPSDQIVLTLKDEFHDPIPGTEAEYHVDKLTVAMNLTSKLDNVTHIVKFEGSLEQFKKYHWTNPIATKWHEANPNYSRQWHLWGWWDSNGNNLLDYCDVIDMMDQETRWIEQFHIESLSTDMWVTKKPLPQPPCIYYVWDQPYVEVQGTQDFDPGWPGWYVRHNSTGVAFTFTNVNASKIVSEYLDITFSLGIGNHMNAEKGLDGLLDVVINPDIENYTIQNVLFDNVDPTNHVYAYEGQTGTYETKAHITVHKSFIHDGNLTIKLLRHTDLPDFLPVAPVCTENPICLGTQDNPTPIIPPNVYENDDPHTVHICVKTDITGKIAAPGEVIMRLEWMAKPVGVHDVAVIEVKPSKTIVGKQEACLVGGVSINVTVENQGDFTETFNVRAYYDSNQIDLPKAVTLNPGENKTLTFPWNITDVAYGNYTISATADSVPGETDTLDNSLTDDWVYVTIPGDVNGDCICDMADISMMIYAFMSTPGDEKWDPNCDVNCDDVVDMADISIAIDNFMKTC